MVRFSTWCNYASMNPHILNKKPKLFKAPKMFLKDSVLVTTGKTGYKKKYHMGRENSLYAVVTVNSDSYQSLVKTIDCLAIIIKPK